ncbi:MAG TPA: class I SAM-dependent methyltransferase [Rubricoccaceae bacterium]
MTAVPLRLALRALIAAQPPLPEPVRSAVARAVSLRLTPGEAADERAVDALRARLAASGATVEVVDYGAGSAGGNAPVRRVADVYRRASSGPMWGRVMTGLVRGLRPARVLELGTNLGVSAAHIALALARNEAEGGPAARLVTLEGAPALADLARAHLAGLGHGEARVRVVVGPFAETLGPVCASDGPFDLVFVDGHHERDAALDYVAAVRPFLAPGAVVVLDDVEPGRPVRAAYRRLAAGSAASVWLGKWGVLVPTPAASAPTAPNAPQTGASPGLARPTALPAAQS